MFTKNELISTQEDLCQLIACPGREEQVAHYIKKTIKPFVDEVEIDPIGNVLAVKNGTNPNGKRILLDAHMDEVGFMISHIYDDGFIKVAPMGGIDTAVLPGTLVQFISTNGKVVKGVFSHNPPHLSKKNDSHKKITFDDLSIDVGVQSSKEIAALGIEIGICGTFYSPFIQLNDKIVMGKAFDNRVGCNIAIQIAKELSKTEHSNTILFNFSVMEEYRQVGAKVGATKLHPDLAYVIEGTTATDTIGVPQTKVITSFGKGPAITIADGSHIVPQALLDTIKQIATKNKINWQYKKPIFGGTNAKEISNSLKGIPTAIIAVPCRYIHGPISMLNVSDLIDTTKLVYSLCI